MEDKKDYCNVQTIQAELSKLITSDNIQKESALTIMQLFYSMETLLMRMLHEKENEISKLEFDLKMLRMELENKRLLDTSIQVQENHSAEIEKHVVLINQLQTEINKRKK